MDRLSGCTLAAVDIPSRPNWNGSPVRLGELFMVRKNNVEARCILRSHPLGWEVCLQVGLNLQFLQTEICRTKADVRETTKQWKAALVEKEWQ